VVGAHKVARCEQRSVLVKAGFVVGGINLLTILSYHLISETLQDGALFRPDHGFLRWGIVILCGPGNCSHD
jgi:hypothetical protein